MPPSAPFTFVQLSDLHLVADDATELRGVRPNALFARAVEQLCALEQPPDLVVLTGDLIGDDDPRSYDALKRLIAPLPCPVRFVLGNHDFIAPFSERVRGRPPPGRWTEVFDLGGHRFITLDSRIDGEDGGALGSEQIAWLASVLEEEPERSSIIFVHHPPARTGVEWLDAHALDDSDELLDVLAGAQGVRGVFFGHVHMPVEVERRGVRCVGVPSTCFQFTDGEVTPKVYPGTPSYNVVRIDEDGMSAVITPIVLASSSDESPTPGASNA